MQRDKQPRPSKAPGALDSLRGHLGIAPGPAAARPFSHPCLSDKEQQALLRLLPDQLYRIDIEQNGAVSVFRDGSHARDPADAAGRPDANKNEADSLTAILSKELTRRGDGVIGKLLRTGGVQILDLRTDFNGRQVFLEVRAVACDGRQVLALVKNVTALKEAQDAVAASAGELAQINNVLQREVSLRAEEEKVIKNGFQRLEKLLEDTIDTLALIVQKKAPHTARHQERVSRLGCAVAREMGLESNRVDIIGLAALLHDLGMALVPTEMVEKQGPLSEAELSLVKNHAEEEFQILKTIDLFLPVAEVVRQHHERMDGSGYPRGLTGDAISIEARVVAVADVVDAMLSDRPHRPALSVDEAMGEIKAGRGTLFDPDAVDACVRLFAERRFDLDGETAVPLESKAGRS